MASKKGKKSRKSPIETELSFVGDDIGNPSTIYMLGGEPIYVHNNINNARIGMKVASKIVDNALQEVEASAKRELDNQLVVLEKKKKSFEDLLDKGKMSFEKFVDAFNNPATNTLKDGTNFPEAIEFLLNLKANALELSRFSSIVETAERNNHTTFKLYSKNEYQEFDIKLAKDKKKELEESMKTILNGLKDRVKTNSIAEELVNGIIKDAFPENDSDSSSSKNKLIGNITKQQMSSRIGTLLEVIGVNERRPLGEHLEVELINISAELRQPQIGTTNVMEQSFNKSDTLVKIYEKDKDEVLYSFTTSDKTAMNGWLTTAANTLEPQLEILPAFTASISDGLDLESKVESRVIGGKYSNDTFNAGADFVRAARYMVANRTAEVARSIHLTRIAATIV